MPTLPQIRLPSETELELGDGNSLAPLSGTNTDELEALPPGSVWGEVWRRRRLVAAVAAVAFCIALAVARLKSAPSLRAENMERAPGSGVAPRVEPSPAAFVAEPSPAAIDTASSPVTPSPEAKSKSTDPSPAGAPEGTKARGHRVGRPVPPPPQKPFMPNQI